MESYAISPIDLLLDVIKDHKPESIWIGSKLKAFRDVENTNRGDIGEEFIHRYLTQLGIPNQYRDSRTELSDIEIFGKRFEIKTASEDKGGHFQFNHIRHDMPNQYLLCLGIRPNEIMFNAWRKGEVAEGVAGHLVRMAKGQSVTFKLTKSPNDMLPIEQLASWVDSHIRD